MSDRPLKTLHLMSCRGWSSDAYWAGRIVQELERQGQEVTLACRPSIPKVAAALRALGVNRFISLQMVSGFAPVADLRDLSALRLLLPRFDLVHVHRGKEHWLAAVANRLLPVPRPLVRTRHIILPVRSHSLNRWLYRQTDLVVTVSEAHRESYLATGLVPPSRLLTLTGGVDARVFRPEVDGLGFRRALGFTPEHRMVGVVARLRAMKGHRTFLEAMSQLVGRDPLLRVLVIGEGPDGDGLRRLGESLGMGEGLRFLGHVEPVPQALAALDVAVYPSHDSEGMGRVLFEYMASGRPIVATRVGLAPEVLKDGDSALLVPPREPASLATAVRHLLDDRSLAAKLGATARQLVEERHSGEMVATQLLDRYRQLVHI
ncbi:MAG: glycosyltransferase family 4 protein [Candidatus Rokubacteria bacterium]|nr:glycosyltransferase family 4 protein [Candidatus Rokubacteria bacterium]